MAKTFLTPIDLNQNELRNVVLQPLGTAPSNPKVGQFYYNSTDKKMYQWNGTSWKQVGDINVIEKIKLNGSEVTPSNDKTVDLGTLLKFVRNTGDAPQRTLVVNVDGTDAYIPLVSSDELALTGYQVRTATSTAPGVVRVDDSLDSNSTNPVQNKALKKYIDDNVYTHPTTGGYQHIPAAGASGQILGWNSAGTAKWLTPDKSLVGLGNVDNTSDANKPISTATQTALDGKVPTTRKVNGKALSADITLSASDVGADASGTAQTKANAALTEAKTYTDNQIAAIIDGADDDTLNSIKELADAIKSNDSAIDALNDIASGKANSDHTHKYAGSSSAGGSATSAVKLDTDTAGSTTQPVYFTGGKPRGCKYLLNKTVPADAKFTDTTYSAATTSENGLMSSTDKTKLNNVTTNTYYKTGSIAAGSKSTTVTLTNSTDKVIAVNCYISGEHVECDWSVSGGTVTIGIAQTITSAISIEVFALTTL